ncbi:hypothetical protein DDE82_006340 [Stemphylium lycopersici]|uniref:Uncharacterized protein n=1 Tax=Stemphylium lycopersici TaxID=183478 RepID=A0A364MYH8_STELY|nr:hypothetical protein TW65_00303 [Stemphylium lycopersici]RAR01726.1 hypothetical protein DDE82_006340 [Stemphylium lycopersici]RAR07190.1 hypothetical protein DDE83_006563 [Stemphylium lycopersici]
MAQVSQRRTSTQPSQQMHQHSYDYFSSQGPALLSRHPVSSSSPLPEPTRAPIPPQSKISSSPISTIDSTYEESYVRTPLHALPFPHPKWGVNPHSGMAYEHVSLMVEAEYEEELEAVDVRESIEGREDDTSSGKRRWDTDCEQGSEEREMGRKKVKMVRNWMGQDVDGE